MAGISAATQHAARRDCYRKAFNRLRRSQGQLADDPAAAAADMQMILRLINSQPGASQ